MHIDTGINMGDIGGLLKKSQIATPTAEEVYQMQIERERLENPSLMNDEDVVQKDAAKEKILEIVNSFGPDIFNIALEEIREEGM